MPDVVSAATRSRMMSGIRGANTKPELAVRKYLHARGFRYRLHRRDLPGRPDIVLPKYRAAVFVHGCFWHAHHGCRYFKMPETRRAFWEAKLLGNSARDAEQLQALGRLGWRVAVIWECALRSRPAEAGAELEEWITGQASTLEIDAIALGQ